MIETPRNEEKPKACCSYEHSEEMTDHAPLCPRRVGAKREAYAVVARLIRQTLEGREVKPSTAMIPTREHAVLRELAKIETAMRDAAQVRT